MADHWLYKYDRGGAFAYSSDGKHFYLAPAEGGGYWAWRDGDWFYAREGGSPLGWVDDGTLYEHGTGKALYYFG